LTLWSTLNTFPAHLSPADLGALSCLRLGGLSFPLFLRGSLEVLGQGLTSLELQSVHFPVDIDLIASCCPRLLVGIVEIRGSQRDVVCLN
jgi:hypothetical protein